MESTTTFSSFNDNLSHEPALIPVVVVGGFMSDGRPDYWGPIDQMLGDSPVNTNEQPMHRRVITVSPGCTSSPHDRACEIFYEIKGGRVDYGEDHSQQHGHKRYGRYHTGLYPEWSTEKPLHFIGHSLGGNTLLALQQLLASDHFFGYTTSADMVLSLTTLCAPLNGTPFSYWMGAVKGATPGTVRRFAPGWILARLVHLVTFFGLNIGYDFVLDHWNFHWKDAHPKPTRSWGFKGLFNCITKPLAALTGLLKYSPFYDSSDNLHTYALPEMAREFSKSWVSNERTWYRSYTAAMTPTPLRKNLNDPATLALSIMGSTIIRRHLDDAFCDDNDMGTSINRCLKCHSAEEWYNGDGMVPFASQYHPGCCCNQNCVHRDIDHMPTQANTTPLVEPGKWESVRMIGPHHVGIVPYREPKPTKKTVEDSHYMRFTKNYRVWLKTVEHAFSKTRQSGFAKKGSHQFNIPLQ